MLEIERGETRFNLRAERSHLLSVGLKCRGAFRVNLRKIDFSLTAIFQTHSTGNFLNDQNTKRTIHAVAVCSGEKGTPTKCIISSLSFSLL